jgi:hydroxymethylglutaryl-CoA lyase
VYQYCLDIQKIFPDVIWNLHFHNTRGLGLANVLAGMMAGITRFDACFAGLGGCPFAPGASGNIATEDLINMCNEIGVTTGIDIDQYIKIGYDVEKYIGGTRSSSILRAGKCSDIIKNKK